MKIVFMGSSENKLILISFARHSQPKFTPKILRSADGGEVELGVKAYNVALACLEVHCFFCVF